MKEITTMAELIALYGFCEPKEDNISGSDDYFEDVDNGFYYSDEDYSFKGTETETDDDDEIYDLTRVLRKAKVAYRRKKTALHSSRREKLPTVYLKKPWKTIKYAHYEGVYDNLYREAVRNSIRTKELLEINKTFVGHVEKSVTAVEENLVPVEQKYTSKEVSEMNLNELAFIAAINNDSELSEMVRKIVEHLTQK